jgi:hypothetical protein
MFERVEIDGWSWLERQWRWKFSIMMGNCELDHHGFNPGIMKGHITYNKLELTWDRVDFLQSLSINITNHTQQFFEQCHTEQW